MPRSRTIKPGFFKNEDLADLDPLACLLFAGLWCWADRAGRLEDRPRRLKLEILPGRDCDADALLDQLAGRGFILRYAIGDARYIQVLAFDKHQNPHVKEQASTIPAPGEHCASTGHAPGEHRASPASYSPLVTSTSLLTTSPEEEASTQYSLSPPAAAERASKPPRSLEPRYSADFEAWWSAYPRKREKVDAYEAYQKTVKAGAAPADLLAAATNCATATEVEGAEERFIKLPATFLGPKRPWLDFRDGVPRPTRTSPAANGRHVIDDPMKQSLRVAMARQAREAAQPEGRLLP